VPAVEAFAVDLSPFLLVGLAIVVVAIVFKNW